MLLFPSTSVFESLYTSMTIMTPRASASSTDSKQIWQLQPAKTRHVKSYFQTLFLCTNISKCTSFHFLPSTFFLWIHYLFSHGDTYVSHNLCIAVYNAICVSTFERYLLVNYLPLNCKLLFYCVSLCCGFCCWLGRLNKQSTKWLVKTWKMANGLLALA